MSIYEETKGRETTNKETGENIIAKQSLTNWEESDRGVWVPEGVIYLSIHQVEMLEKCLV